MRKVYDTIKLVSLIWLAIIATLSALPCYAWAPVACFTVSNESPNVCETVTFNATCSYDHEDAIVKYEWDLDGDCTYETDTGNDPIVTYHYDKNGTYTVKLRVTDNDGLTNETSMTILVRGHPVAHFTWIPPSPQVCETVTFDASASTPDGGVIISWDWDFGDTTTGSGEIVTHHYDACGDYNVTLTVTDSEGKSDTTTKRIHISSSVESSDSYGNKKDVFIKCALVYAYGFCYAPNTTYPIYVVENTTWTDGMPIPPRVPGTATIVTTNSTGAIAYSNLEPPGTSPALIWTHADPGEYDIVVDVNNDGFYNAAVDTLDDNDVDGAGFTVTEFAGDINNDGKVDIIDIVIAALAFGSSPGDPNWNQDADLNDDHLINIVDLIVLGRNFGKTV